MSHQLYVHANLWLIVHAYCTRYAQTNKSIKSIKTHKPPDNTSLHKRHYLWLISPPNDTAGDTPSREHNHVNLIRPWPSFEDIWRLPQAIPWWKYIPVAQQYQSWEAWSSSYLSLHKTIWSWRHIFTAGSKLWRKSLGQNPCSCIILMYWHIHCGVTNWQFNCLTKWSYNIND